MAVRSEQHAPAPRPHGPGAGSPSALAALAQPERRGQGPATAGRHPSRRLTVVLPTLDEAENLPPLVEELLALPLGETELSVLVADSASPDGTGTLADALAREHPGRVGHLALRPGRGLGRAYVAGFGKALVDGADLVLQMDADFSHPPRFVPELLAELDEQQADLVIGSRYAPGGRLGEDWPLWRRWLSTFANGLYVRAALGLPLHDATGGFRLWRRETLLGLGLERIGSEGYVFQVEMAALALRLGYRVVETPIEFRQRRAGTSKMSWRIQAEAAWRVFAVRAAHARLSPADRHTALPRAVIENAQVSDGARRAAEEGPTTSPRATTSPSPEAAA